MPSEEEDPPTPNPPQIKSSSLQVYLNNFCWVPDSCHGEAGTSLCKLFEKVRANNVFGGGYFQQLPTWTPTEPPRASQSPAEPSKRPAQRPLRTPCETNSLGEPRGGLCPSDCDPPELRSFGWGFWASVPGCWIVASLVALSLPKSQTGATGTERPAAAVQKSCAIIAYARPRAPAAASSGFERRRRRHRRTRQRRRQRRRRQTRSRRRRRRRQRRRRQRSAVPHGKLRSTDCNNHGG